MNHVISGVIHLRRFFFFFSSRRRHTRFDCDWSSDVCSSDLQATETVTVDYVPGVTTGEELERAVEQAGFKVAAPIAAEDPLERERLARAQEIRTLTWKLVLAGVATVVAMAGAMLLMADRPMDSFKRFDLLGRLLMPAALKLWAIVSARTTIDLFRVKVDLAGLTLPAVTWAGQQFFKGTWSGFKHRTADINTLIA